MLTFCLYRSWETSVETARLSRKIVQVLLKLLSYLDSTSDPQRFHMGLRLFAHFGVLLITNILFASSLEVSLPGGNRKNIHVFLLGSSAYAFIAVAAEVGKLAVRGRHLTWSETGLNVFSVVVGVAVVCLAVRMYALRKERGVVGH